MQTVLIEFWGMQITGWKIVGYSGVLMFSARWLVQMWASRAAKRPTVPIAFWLMSVVGSLACLAYFIFGKNDSVGILSNLFPCAVAAYNLYLEITHRRTRLSNPPDGPNSSAPVNPDSGKAPEASPARR